MTARYPLALALSPNWSGMGYVLFDKPLSPFDWGVKAGRGKDKNQAILRGVRKLIELYRPYVVILEDWTSRTTPRHPRIEALYRAILNLCAEMSVPVERVSMGAVRRAFAVQGATTKHAIAQAIAKHIPALGYYVRVRKIWEPEPPTQTLFDAAALALTFFQRTTR